MKELTAKQRHALEHFTIGAGERCPICLLTREERGAILLRRGIRHARRLAGWAAAFAAAFFLGRCTG